MGDGPPGFRQDCTCPALLRYSLRLRFASLTGLSPSAEGLPSPLLFVPLLPFAESPTTPTVPQHVWFRLLPFRSPLLRESLLFSFPMGTYMFQFPTFALCFSTVTDSSARRVVPFGYLRIISYLPIPAAFRSLSRPSSPLRAKASTVCPFFALYLAISLFEAVRSRTMLETRCPHLRLSIARSQLRFEPGPGLYPYLFSSL